MKTEELKKLKDLALAATRGPWKRSDRPVGPFWHISSGHTIDGKPCISGSQAIGSVHAENKRSSPAYAAMFQANADFIAAANPVAVLDLIEMAERAAAMADCRALQEAWEYSFIHSSALGRGDEEIGPCLTYIRSQAFGTGCMKQRKVFVCIKDEWLSALNVASSPAAPVVGLAVPPDMAARTERIRMAHASPAIPTRTKAALIRDVECLLAHIAMLSTAPASEPVTAKCWACDGRAFDYEGADRVECFACHGTGTAPTKAAPVTNEGGSAAVPAQAGSIDTPELRALVATIIADSTNADAWAALFIEIHARIAAARQEGDRAARASVAKALHFEGGVGFAWPLLIDSISSAVDALEKIEKEQKAARAPSAQAGSELAENGYVLMPIDLDDELWTAGCKAFRAAINQMTGRDGYVVKKTYAGMVKAALAKKGEQQ